MNELEGSGLSYQYRAEAGSSSAARFRACRRCGRGPGGIRNRGGQAAPGAHLYAQPRTGGSFGDLVLGDKMRRSTVGWQVGHRETFGGRLLASITAVTGEFSLSSFLVSLL